MKKGILLFALVLASPLSAQSEPARDSRGIPVVSNQAAVPPGANATPGSSDPSQVFAPRPSSGDYPKCTREVTDGCIQAHERQPK